MFWFVDKSTNEKTFHYIRTISTAQVSQDQIYYENYENLVKSVTRSQAYEQHCVENAASGWETGLCLFV